MSSSPKTTSKGGFLSGIPKGTALPILSMAQSGCCGATTQTTSASCCGEPVIQLTVTTGCCGEPGTTVVGMPPSTQTGCCN